mgnify:CR=1 FL=1
MILKKFTFILLLLFFNFISKAQSNTNNWVIGIGVNAVDYFPVTEISFNGNTGGFMNQITNAKDHLNVYGPRINVTHYWKNNISFDASFSLNKISKIGDAVINDTNYYAFDASVQYSILNPENKFSPYILVGGGYTFALSSGGTLNLGLGSNLWLSDSIGINTQGMYKYNSPDFGLFSHFYYSFSVIFNLNSGGNGFLGGGRGRNCF